MPKPNPNTINNFLAGKSIVTINLFNFFVERFMSIGEVSLHPAKIMIGIATPKRRIAYITHLGKNFIHVVFPFEKPYKDNLCFQKIAQVPGDSKQFNHHFRMLAKEDVNTEVMKFMKLAYQQGR